MHLRPLSLVKVLPSLVTLLSLSVGLSSIRFALDDKWEASIACIIVAGILDFMDGGLARLFKVASHFGAELDSLCDLVVFGVAPAMVTYLWTFQYHSIKLFSWGAVLFFASCTAMRLARFNTMMLFGKKDDVVAQKFFVGVPAPAGALLALMPLMLSLELIPAFSDTLSLRSYPRTIIGYEVIVGLLVASRIPTFSLKRIHIKPEYFWIVFIGLALSIVALIVATWYTIPFGVFLYLLSIPISIRVANKSL